MREILSDLVAEQQHLDQFLQTLRDRQWPTPTPAAGWTIQDTVSHLAYVESFAAEVLAEGQERIDAENITDLDAWTAIGVRSAGQMLSRRSQGSCPLSGSPGSSET